VSVIVVRHRCNTRDELRRTPSRLGVEVDVRSRGSDLVLHHDPFAGGERLDDWIADYRQRLLVLNVKEEGLEQALIERMATAGVADYFFLDQSFPFLLRTARAGERRCAVRVSEYESIETALALRGMIDWVWIDCFTRFPLGGAAARRLQEAGMRLCLVSPELQGRTDPGAIDEMKAHLSREFIEADAVCTKSPERW
jgi:hypothetical protein